MKSKKRGKNSSQISILNVSPNGIWILVKDREYFLDQKNYPWFRKAKVSSLFKVEFLHNKHLYWPDLDIDLEIESLEEPQRYPLIAKCA